MAIGIEDRTETVKHLMPEETQAHLTAWRPYSIAHLGCLSETGEMMIQPTNASRLFFYRRVGIRIESTNNEERAAFRDQTFRSGIIVRKGISLVSHDLSGCAELISKNTDAADKLESSLQEAGFTVE